MLRQTCCSPFGVRRIAPDMLYKTEPSNENHQTRRPSRVFVFYFLFADRLGATEARETWGPGSSQGAMEAREQSGRPGSSQGAAGERPGTSQGGQATAREVRKQQGNTHGVARSGKGRPGIAKDSRSSQEQPGTAKSSSRERPGAGKTARSSQEEVIL